MAVKTKNIERPSLEPISRRTQILNLMKYHKDTFIKEGNTNPKFIPRLCYKLNNQQVITFFEKEIAGGLDIYVEFCDRELNPEDDNRTLWKWIFNPEYSTEYDQTEPHPITGDIRYIIPVSELVDVRKFHEKQENDSRLIPQSQSYDMKQVDTVVETPVTQVLSNNKQSSVEDVPYSTLTIRDYAAIQWKMPVSKKDWLNTLIKETFNLK